MVKRLRGSHIGIEGTWRRARGVRYLPGITTHLKDHLKTTARAM